MRRCFNNFNPVLGNAKIFQTPYKVVKHHNCDIKDIKTYRRSFKEDRWKKNIGSGFDIHSNLYSRTKWQDFSEIKLTKGGIAMSEKYIESARA